VSAGIPSPTLDYCFELLLSHFLAPFLKRKITENKITRELTFGQSHGIFETFHRFEPTFISFSGSVSQTKNK